MKLNYHFKYLGAGLLFFLLFSACENPKTPTFESSLIPSIQVQSEPRFYEIEDRMEHYKVPGVQIAIVKNGKLVWNKGYGIARVDDSIAVNAKTVFQAGSISKSITAFIVMRLVEKGTLELDTDINTYLKTWKLPKSKFSENTTITLRMLLSHTSGMNNSNHPGFPQDGPLPTINQLLNGYGTYKKVDFDTLPNIRYRYSNTGYAVIQKVVEDATGKSFNIIASEEVFQPLNMRYSTFVPLKYSAEDTDVSYAYDRQGKLVKGYWYNAAAKTSGGLWTTAEDLTKFLIGFQQILNDEKGIVSTSTAQTMIRRVKANYGLGFNIKNDKDSLIFYHTGKNKGFTNIMMASKQGKNAIVVLTNGDNGGYLFSEIIRGISHENNWSFLEPKVLETVEVSVDILRTYLGTYQLILEDETYTLKIALDGKNLQLIDLDEDNKTYPLRALSETKFRDIDDGEKVDFIKNESGEIVLLWDEEYKFEKIK